MLYNKEKKKFIMSSKEDFEKKAEDRFEELDEAIENASSEEAYDALVEARENLEKTVELSAEAEEWIAKQAERTEKINAWKEETKYEYNKNIDIINDTIHEHLKASVDDWYEDFKGEDIIDKDALKRAMDTIEYEFMMPDSVELKTEVVKATQQLSGNSEYCVYVDYKFRMDEQMAMHKRWKFDITDIVRDNKLGWLFD